MSQKKSSGRTISLSLPRRWVGDLAAFSQKVPIVALKKNLLVPDLIAARRTHPIPPRWSALVTRGFGIVSQRLPELRRSFLEFPIPRLYEHPVSVAALVVNREFLDEPAVFFGLMQEPENLGLQEIGARVQELVANPVMQNGAYRRLIRITQMPRPLRRLLWSYGVCVSGRLKSKIFGTFAVNSVAAMRVEMDHFLSPVTTMLYYAPPSTPEGSLQIQAVIDHRVFDASLMARALDQLESVLNTEIAMEVSQIPR